MPPAWYMLDRFRSPWNFLYGHAYFSPLSSVLTFNKCNEQEISAYSDALMYSRYSAQIRTTVSLH